MIFYKIYLVNNYETEQEISNNPLKRGYLKAGADELIEQEPFILVFVDNDMLVHEFFTGQYLKGNNITGNENDNNVLSFNDMSYFNFLPVNYGELPKYEKLRNNKNLRLVIQKVIFNENNDFEVSNMEELANDRALQFNAYENGLTSFNPYTDSFINKRSLRLRR